MKYELLGRSGLRVSQLCLGTMTFGEDWQWGADKNVSRQMFERFGEAGGNFLDTANGYTEGTSEKFVGEFIAPDRDRWVLATKFSFPDSFDESKLQAATAGNSRKNMLRSVEGSLKRLGTDYIDLLYLHAWDFTTYPEEVMRTLDDLVSSGKVLYVGVSDTPAWIVARSNTIAELRGWTPFCALQVEYSLVERTVERDLVPMAHTLGLGIAPWSPLAGGILSGKYSSGDQSTRGQDIPERALKIAGVVGEVAKEIGCTPSQLAIAWLLAKDTVPILGARKVEQFEDNLKAVDVQIPPNALQKLDEATAIEPGFPHDFLARDFVKTKLISGKPELFEKNAPRG